MKHQRSRGGRSGLEKVCIGKLMSQTSAGGGGVGRDGLLVEAAAASLEGGFRIEGGKA